MLLGSEEVTELCLEFDEFMSLFTVLFTLEVIHVN